MRRIAKEKNKRILFVFCITIIVAFCFYIGQKNESTEHISGQGYSMANKEDYLSSLPENIRELYYKNPDAHDFVFSYNELYGEKMKVDLSEYKNSKQMPLFMQWDKRWGYMEYSSDCVAITGCGPVCLSMVAFYLTEDQCQRITFG